MSACVCIVQDQLEDELSQGVHLSVFQSEIRHHIMKLKSNEGWGRIPHNFAPSS